VPVSQDQPPRARRQTGSNLMEKRTREVIGGALRPNDPRRFLVEAMIGAMNADGSVDEREMAVLQKHIDEHDLFAGVSPQAAKTLVDLATDAIKFAGNSVARVPAIAKGLPSRIHRLTAYAMSAEIVAADNQITHEEMTFLEALRQQVRVGHAEAQDIFNALHEKRLSAHLDDRVLRIRSLLPVAVEIFTLRAYVQGKVTDDHRFHLRDFFLAIPDLIHVQDDMEGELYKAFKKPRVPGFNVVLELQSVGQTLPDIVDRWWMVVYALAAEPPSKMATWRVLPFASMLQQAFGLSDADMDMAAADAQIFPASLPRPA
jgi:uncharacterized membrane protein YebE (DUF533 family)